MPNHAHLVVQALPSGSLSEVMHEVSTSYTRYFNGRHHRVGHLYQGRFYSNFVDRETYLLEVTRYVHLNPFRARLVERPEDYPWSSYRIYVGLERDPWNLVDCQGILKLFGSTIQEQVECYRQFVEIRVAHEMQAWVDKLRRDRLSPPARWLTKCQALFPAQKVPGTSGA